jgi:glucosamine-6-phosphate deaminase
MFQGNDSREFWVRAEDRKETAKQYDALGLQNTKLLRLLNV